jgi:hypothetical protein
MPTENEKLNVAAPKYLDILSKTEPYVLGYPENMSDFNLSPFGVDIPKKNILSCIDSSNAIFYDALQTLDKLSFGPVGMPMEKWVFFDCGEMVGGIFGLAIPAEKADEDLFKTYGLDLSYKGLIPVSMYIAIPMASRKSWFGHNLCSANSFLGEKYSFSGLAILTKVLGIKTFNFSKGIGATQWDSKALHIHLQMADMEILSAFTPAHSFDQTITYRSDYCDENLLASLSGNKRLAETYDFLVDGKDEKVAKELQERIVAGEKFKIVGRPIAKDGKVYLPIKSQ